MRLGAHLTIAGGLYKAVERAAEYGCESLQVFLTNPRSWKMSSVDDDAVARFRETRALHGIDPVVAHMPYLPNIGSIDVEIYAKSVASLDANLTLCDRLGVDSLVMHMGKSKGATEEEAMMRMLAAIDKTYSRRKRRVTLCLENTAGQGTELGRDFATLGRIMDATRAPDRMGLCVDTCHAFAAGYDLRTKAGVQAMVSEIDSRVGLERLRVLHINDSKYDLGARRDRHAHIGEGYLGEAAFRHVINHPHLRGLPGILETPQDDPGDVERNLATLRRLTRKGRSG